MDQQKKLFPSQEARTTIKIFRNTKILFDDLVSEEREEKIHFLDKIIFDYAKKHHPERYDLYLNNELKGQK
ncbi:hypothetical protein [Mammaliicoccus sciuri]|uniref:hypothetical protein n=1 Tax=Mammaliicoccus sciuri TaxID=1296 RepID=UPI000E67F3F6|nr:hypothetical protein [Mammaliicoccus sciuri]RIN92369.1 hypothetical protein BU003_01950 [Mammaliicoccus sciuri]RIN97140.1 hypothetical protein BU002_02140 [Mammaliicoccus sciuri]